jgi:hypothetical protein
MLQGMAGWQSGTGCSLDRISFEKWRQAVNFAWITLCADGLK